MNKSLRCIRFLSCGAPFKELYLDSMTSYQGPRSMSWFETGKVTIRNLAKPKIKLSGSGDSPLEKSIWPKRITDSQMLTVVDG